MNIRQELEKIKKKYGLIIQGKVYQDVIKDQVRDILKAIPKDKVVSIKGAGEHTKELLELGELAFEIEGIYDKDNMQSQEKEYAGKIYTVYPEEEMALRSRDIVIVSSYAHRKGMSQDIRQLLGDVLILDIYEELKKKGYNVNEAFYRNTGDMYEYVLYYLQKYSDLQNAVNLRNLFVAYLQICDFVNYEKYSKLYIDKKYDQWERVEKAFNEVTALMEEVKTIIKSRKQKDIIMVWNDQMGYEDLKYAPFMVKESKNSLFFENGYGAAPFTYPSLMGIFRGLHAIDDKCYFIDDKCINEENSDLLKYLTGAGYEYIYIGNYGNGRLFDQKHVALRGAYSCSTFHFIDLFQKLIEEERPVFSLVHVSVETHNPYLSGELTGAKWYDWPRFSGDSEAQALEQMKQSLAYWDKQLAYFMPYFSKQAVKIYMSDHGKRYHYQPIYKEPTTHITFFIVGEGVPSCRYGKMFSLFDTKKVLKCIVKNEYEEDKMCKDYVLMQEISLFNKACLAYYVENDSVESGYSFRMVRTEKELYVNVINGNRYYYRLPDEENNCINQKEFREEIRRLDELAGNYFENEERYREKIEFFCKKFDNHE